ncbi:serine/threonine-protein phosphatase 4 regulatory subunit 2-B-like [Saccostrea echinata]|uniref:serine/threonine-protein phosphatase 4 regulatory subunit 2-B-like n=1 Tax=Saccostrea echinata TaxID=191078 RepID=UPI002A83E9B0|nr:serine/threonine-protein phosphatase 4 regulatory subunit 2-B-like [Saccostrea echinata]
MVVYSKLAMDNQEEVLDALNNFEKKKGDIPPVLEQYLKTIAKTGETLFPWPRVKSLFISKLEDVMTKFHQDLPADHLPPCPNVDNPKFKEMKKRILDSVNKFSGAPFTIQRLCELLTDPKKHYKRTDKFLRGIEKNVLVISTVDPFGNKIVSESRANLVNGLEGSPVNGNEADSPTTTTDLTPVQYSSFPTQQQTNWTTDSWAGVGPSQGTPDQTISSSDAGPLPSTSDLSSDQTPRDNQLEGSVPESWSGQAMSDREKSVCESEEVPCESEDTSPAKKPKFTGEISEENSSIESPTSDNTNKQTDTPLNTEPSREQSDFQSSEIVTSEESEVTQRSEVNSEAETSDSLSDKKLISEQEQRDLSKGSPESSQQRDLSKGSPESSQHDKSVNSDSQLPQKGITSTKDTSENGQDQSQSPENSSESLQNSSEDKVEHKSSEETSTQPNQSSLEESTSSSLETEERMSLDSETENVETTNPSADSKDPVATPTEEATSTEGETPMEED